MKSEEKKKPAAAKKRAGTRAEEKDAELRAAMENKRREEEIYNKNIRAERARQKVVQELLSPETLLKRLTQTPIEEILKFDGQDPRDVAYLYCAELYEKFLTDREAEAVREKAFELAFPDEMADADADCQIIVTMGTDFAEVSPLFQLHFSIFQTETAKLALQAKEATVMERERKFFAFFENHPTAEFPFDTLKHTIAKTETGEYICVEEPELRAKMKRQTARVKEQLSFLKSFITAFDDILRAWDMKRNFLPLIVESCINQIERNAVYSSLDVPPELQEETLRKRTEAGEKVTAADIERAIFPDYQQAKVVRGFYDKAMSYFKQLDFPVFAIKDGLEEYFGDGLL